jgi:hypothetical protein
MTFFKMEEIPHTSIKYLQKGQLKLCRTSAKIENECKKLKILPAVSILCLRDYIVIENVTCVIRNDKQKINYMLIRITQF